MICIFSVRRHSQRYRVTFRLVDGRERNPLVDNENVLLLCSLVSLGSNTYRESSHLPRDSLLVLISVRRWSIAPALIVPPCRLTWQVAKVRRVIMAVHFVSLSLADQRTWKEFRQLDREKNSIYIDMQIGKQKPKTNDKKEAKISQLNYRIDTTTWFGSLTEEVGVQ